MHEHIYIYLLFLQRLCQDETKDMKKDKVNNNQENPKGPQTDGKFQHIYTRCKVDRDVHFWEQSGPNILKLPLLKKVSLA